MTTRWQTEMAEAVRDPAELLALLELDPRWLEPARRAAAGFPLRVPRAFLARIAKGDPADPLLRQVLPLGEELAAAPGYSRDPVGDLPSVAAKGLLHKYQGRVLLITTGACGVHCRYCFRRHFPYAEENARSGEWKEALDYLAADRSVREVILSGGDPLALNDERLAALERSLSAIPHIRRLRIHTRQPVVLPSRVDEALLGWLKASRLQKVMVLHVNHAREIDAAVKEACARLRGAGVTLLNQTVLLRNVNDSADALEALSEALFEAQVLPYYLNLLDPVEGAAHFDVPEAEALALLDAIRARLPGYLVPKLVREVPGAPAKMPVFPPAR
ncbi:MAG TPA: EF-P beta-lysylation protein EpmB [Gammaproteobacteria bacterium]|jgi:EF-P beta-lysylation protein EpmB|nr:EF-P beta-lysylation protein EpmB [Gammaproteobacteria bacterium]